MKNNTFISNLKFVILHNNLIFIDLFNNLVGIIHNLNKNHHGVILLSNIIVFSHDKYQR